MERILTEEEIIRFIERYGDGDLYYSHHMETDGRLTVFFFPNFTKFVEEENVEELKEEIKEHPHLRDKYVEEIILTDRYAYMPNGNNKNPLVLNYGKFLKDLDEEKKISQKKELHRRDNLKFDSYELEQGFSRKSKDNKRHGSHNRER